MHKEDGNGIFDERRQRIYDALFQYSPVVAGSYRIAIRTLQVPAHPGEERARVSIIGNAIREVMITLPSIMGDSSDAVSTGADPNSLLRELPEKLAQFSDLDLKQDLDYIPLPRDAAALIAELVTAASQETKNLRDNISSLIAVGSANNHPAIQQWLKANQFFVKCTHLGRPPSDVGDDMSDEKIEENIRIVEDLMETRISGFFDSRDSLDELLNNINSDEEDTDEQI